MAVVLPLDYPTTNTSNLISVLLLLGEFKPSGTEAIPYIPL